jgi:hypothetical protein
LVFLLQEITLIFTCNICTNAKRFHYIEGMDKSRAICTCCGSLFVLLALLTCFGSSLAAYLENNLINELNSLEYWTDENAPDIKIPVCRDVYGFVNALRSRDVLILVAIMSGLVQIEYYLLNLIVHQRNYIYIEFILLDYVQLLR